MVKMTQRVHGRRTGASSGAEGAPYEEGAPSPLVALAAMLSGAVAVLGGLGCHPSGAKNGEAVVDVGSRPEGAAPKSAGLCSSAGYCWENPLPSAGFLNAVWGAAPNDVYAVGDGGRILHFDGTSWQVQATGTDTWITSVWGSGPDDVYALSDGGTILHRRGGAWKKEQIDDGGYLTAVWGSGPNDVFVVGSNGAVFHFDGREWSGQSTGTTAHLQAVWGSGPRDVYAVGFTGAESEGAVMHYDGSSWDEPRPLGKSLCGVWGTGPGNVWIAGTDDRGKVGLWKLDSSEWRTLRVPKSGRAMALSGLGGKPVLLGFVSTPGDNLIQYGKGVAFTIEESGGLWQRRDLISVSVPIGQPNWGLWGDGKSSLFVVGWWGVTGRLDMAPGGAAAGSELDKGAFHTLNGNAAIGKNFTGVWGTSTSDVVAVGPAGLMMRYDGKGWSPDPSGKNHDLTGIHGAGDTLVASGRGGVLLVRRKGRWTELDTGTSEDLWSVWTSGEEIFASASHGTVVRCDAAGCAPMKTGVKDELWSIWGTSPKEVIVAGEKGTLLRWDGASWKRHAVPADAGFSALGSDGKGGVLALTLTTTYRLADGVLTRVADGGGWAVSDGGDGEIRAVYGGGGAPVGVRHFDGTKWHEEALEMGPFETTAARLTGIWSSGGEVFIVGDGGTILHKRP